MKVKSYFTNPTAFHNEMSGSVDEGRAVDAVHLTLSPVTPSRQNVEVQTR